MRQYAAPERRWLWSCCVATPDPRQGAVSSKSRPCRRRSRHSASVTGCTDRRVLLTSTMSARRGSSLHICSVTGVLTGRTALISTQSQRSSSVVLSGWLSAMTSTMPTTAFSRLRVIKEAQVACFHRPHVVARLVVAHAVPFLSGVALGDLIVPGPCRGFGFEKPVGHGAAPFVAVIPRSGAGSSGLAMACVTVIGPSSTAATVVVIGISTLSVAAIRAMARAVAMPSVVAVGSACALRAKRAGHRRSCGIFPRCRSATRSPKPDSPPSVSACAPCASAKRVISAEPRVSSAARALSPRPAPDGDAAGDGDDVLQRAAQFDAGHIGAAVKAQGRRGKLRLQATGDRVVGRGEGQGGRQAGGDIDGKAGAGEQGRGGCRNGLCEGRQSGQGRWQGRCPCSRRRGSCFRNARRGLSEHVTGFASARPAERCRRASPA